MAIRIYELSFENSRNFGHGTSFRTTGDPQADRTTFALLLLDCVEHGYQLDQIVSDGLFNISIVEFLEELRNQNNLPA